MNFIKGIDNYNAKRPAAVTIGKLDALHLGHRLLIDNIRKRDGMDSVVIIFSVSPRVALHKEEVQAKYIITDAERIAMLSEMGVDTLLEIVFDENTIHMEPEDFLRLLRKQLNMQYLCVGEDFRFGYKGRGDVLLIREMSKELEFDFEPVKKLEYQNEVISSSRIRSEIAKGNIRIANEMLGYAFFLDGTIRHGKRLGRTIGFPTINQIPTPEKLMPAFGVYVTRVAPYGRTYMGMTNIGMRPTVNDDSSLITCETYIFNFDGDLYGEHLRVEFIEFVRPEEKFESVEALKARIAADEEDIRKLFIDK